MGEGREQAARDTWRVHPRPLAAVKLSCSYSGFVSPRVEWKFAQGDTTSLVCYNNKITGQSARLPPWDPPGFRGGHAPARALPREEGAP